MKTRIYSNFTNNTVPMGLMLKWNNINYHNNVPTALRLAKFE